MMRKKQGFDTDHSSQSYEYYSEKQLESRDIEYLRALAPHNTKFTKNKMKLFVKGEGYPSIVCGSEITAKYFSCMVSEDYDWVTCEIVIDYNQDVFKELKQFAREDHDHTLSVGRYGDKIIVSACVHIDYGSVHDIAGGNFLDALLKLFIEIRKNVIEKRYEEMKLLAKYCEEPKSIMGFVPISEQSKRLKDYLDTSGG